MNSDDGTPREVHFAQAIPYYAPTKRGGEGACRK